MSSPKPFGVLMIGFWGYGMVFFEARVGCWLGRLTSEPLPVAFEGRVGFEDSCWGTCLSICAVVV